MKQKFGVALLLVAIGSTALISSLFAEESATSVQYLTIARTIARFT